MPRPSAIDPRDLDLRRSAVFVDFDGTISEDDTGVHLLDRLAEPGWWEVSTAYQRGEIGSRECLLDEWELLPKDEELLRRVAREVPIDPSAAPLIEALRTAGAEVTIVSDGFGIRADEVAAELDVPLLTNAPDWSTGCLEFPNEDRCCACASCGTCKQAPIKDARNRGLATVLIGDGTSDYKAALLADVVFAKGPLAVWCAHNDVAFHPFDRLADVLAALV